VAYEKALELTTNKYHQGVVSKLDVTQAQNQIDTTRADATDTDVLRSQYEHAIAVLLGKAPADLTIPPNPLDIPPPAIPAVLPGALLERRPTSPAPNAVPLPPTRRSAWRRPRFIPPSASAPRPDCRATACSIGSVGRAASGRWDRRSRRRCLKKAARQAFKEEMIADYDATVANYRQTVLTAFEQVEDNLAALRILEREEKQQQQA